MRNKKNEIKFPQRRPLAFFKAFFIVLALICCMDCYAPCLLSAEISPGDCDGDGIPDEEEVRFKTNPKVKTLFVIPKVCKNRACTYWDGFIALFPDARPGFANIPAFTNAGIEIKVIEDINYDPASEQRSCHILALLYFPDDFFRESPRNDGHTFFDPYAAVWSWDTKGYTPSVPNKYGYKVPEIYGIPLDNYFKEGAYQSIKPGQTPQLPPANSTCSLSQCYDWKYCSPMNLNKNYDPVNGPFDGLPDDTVEFNPITFDKTNKMITSAGGREKEYDKDTVLRRTITHELGHAVLTGSNCDHCADPKCIMYQFVLDWEMWDFGSVGCTHKERIRAGIHNGK